MQTRAIGGFTDFERDPKPHNLKRQQMRLRVAHSDPDLQKSIHREGAKGLMREPHNAYFQESRNEPDEPVLGQMHMSGGGHAGYGR